MIWSDIRHSYPDQWLVVEAIKAHTTADNQRILDQIADVEQCKDGGVAMKRYRQLHLEYPMRELYFVHTSRKELDIRERQWLGVRRSAAKID